MGRDPEYVRPEDRAGVLGVARSVSQTLPPAAGDLRRWALALGVSKTSDLYSALLDLEDAAKRVSNAYAGLR